MNPYILVSLGLPLLALLLAAASIWYEIQIRKRVSFWEEKKEQARETVIQAEENIARLTANKQHDKTN